MPENELPDGQAPDRGWVLSELPPAVRRAVAEARVEVARLHAELPRWGLVVWTAGNVSARVHCADELGVDLMVIKPSGVGYDELSADVMVVCTLDGTKINDGTPQRLAPSSDTAAHAHVYREMPEVGGVCHTHSTHAVAWAIRQEPIPCLLTMMADEFGGEIPVGPLAMIGDDSIGKGIVDTLRAHRSRAVLMANHGPFTVGASAKDAVKTAVMCEEVAHAVHVARTGEAGKSVQPLGPALVARLYDRYQNVYGQH